jgi:hypothetical protein
MATIEQLNTVHTETLGTVTTVTAGDIVAPAPLDITDVNVTSTATAKTVSSGSISAFSLAQPNAVGYTSISTSEEVTNESLNRTAETLKTSINNELGAWAGQISTAVNNLRNETDSSISTLVGNVNAQLTQLKAEADGQVGNINTQIDALIADMNAQMGVIRIKNAEQSANTATQINTISGELTANIIKVKTIADDAQTKIAALDDVYKTDVEAAERIAAVNALIDTLNGADLDFVTAVDGAIDEINQMKRIKVKEIVVNSATGVYNFNTSVEGFGEFLSVGDYEADITVIGNGKVHASISNKTEAGFNISLTSNGVHFVPQPIDASTTPVTVSVEVKHSKRNPLTFNVDTLNTSFVTDGSGTDSNTVGE